MWNKGIAMTPRQGRQAGNTSSLGRKIVVNTRGEEVTQLKRLDFVTCRAQTSDNASKSGERCGAASCQQMRPLRPVASFHPYTARAIGTHHYVRVNLADHPACRHTWIAGPKSCLCRKYPSASKRNSGESRNRDAFCFMPSRSAQSRPQSLASPVTCPRIVHCSPAGS
jgi:hypothetical protein